jgi:predicted permease
LELNLLNLWIAQGELLILLALGVGLYKLKLINSEAKLFLTDFVIYVAVPANIVVSFIGEIDFSVFPKIAIVLTISLFIQLLSYTLSRVLYRKEPDDLRNVMRYGILVSNSGFMGIPVSHELFGIESLMYTSIYLIPQRVAVWTAGLSCFVKQKGQPTKKVVRQVALHPGLVSVYIGLILLLFKIPLPSLIIKTTKSVGLCTTPLSMILIGAIVGETGLKGLRIDLKIIGYSFVRLILIPLVTYIGCRLFSVEPLLTGITVALAGMPVGTTTAILASKYGANTSFASNLVTVTTLLSMITIPLWASVLLI